MPNEGLQHGFKIRNAVEFMGSGKAEAIELTLQIR